MLLVVFPPGTGRTARGQGEARVAHWGDVDAFSPVTRDFISLVSSGTSPPYSFQLRHRLRVGSLASLPTLAQCRSGSVDCWGEFQQSPGFCSRGAR